MNNGPIIHLQSLDYAVLAGFMALLLVAWWGAKRKTESVFEFLSAGRSLTLPAFVATLVSTWYGGILGIAESVSYFGTGTWLLLGVPYYIFAALYAFFMSEKIRGADQITIPERFESRFGKAPALAAALLVLLLAVPAAHVLMLGTMVQALSGWSLLLSMVAISAIVSLMLFRSGLLADVRIGLVAFCLMFLGFAVAFFTLNRQTSLPLAISSLPPASQSFTGGADWINIISFFILGAWTIVDPGFHQRVSSAHSPTIGKRGILVSILCWAAFDFLSISCAIYALHLKANTIGTKIESSVSGMMLFPSLAETALPAGIKGLFVIGILGTILSACCGYALVAGGTIGREIIGRISPQNTETKFTQWGIVASLALAIPIALISGQSVVALWYGWAGAVIGSLLIPFVLSYRSSSRWNPTWLSIGMVLPCLLAIGWMAFAIRSGNPLMNVKAFGSEFSLGTLVPSFSLSALILGGSRLLCKKNV